MQLHLSLGREPARCSGLRSRASVPRAPLLDRALRTHVREPSAAVGTWPTKGSTCLLSQSGQSALGWVTEATQLQETCQRSVGTWWEPPGAAWAVAWRRAGVGLAPCGLSPDP